MFGLFFDPEYALRSSETPMDFCLTTWPHIPEFKLIRIYEISVSTFPSKWHFLLEIVVII
jgi:hypothetical protein